MGMRVSSSQQKSRSTAAPDRAGPPLSEALRPPGPVQLELSEQVEPGRTVVEARGEVDVMTAPQLSAALDAILRRHDGDVVVDLSHATFMDSAGLHVLLNAARRLTRRSRRLQVACAPGQVRHVIELARLGETLNLTGGG